MKNLNLIVRLWYNDLPILYVESNEKFYELKNSNYNQRKYTYQEKLS